MERKAIYVLLEKDDKYLIMRRRGTGYMDGYHCPIAGVVEEGEEVIAAAIREAKEETDIDIQAKDLILMHQSSHIGKNDVMYKDHFFVCTNWEREPIVAEPDKSDKIFWIDAGDGYSYFDQYMADIIKDIGIERSKTKKAA